MTLKRFQQTEAQTRTANPEDTASDRGTFPQIAPLDDGEIERRDRGIVGWLHSVAEDDAVAFCATRVADDHYFGIFNGYSISIDVIGKIQQRVEQFVDEGVISPSDAETIYVLFFIQEEQEVLQFTLEQYREEAEEWTNSGGGGPTDDNQRVMPEDRSQERWEDGFQHVVKLAERSNQTYRALGVTDT